jgi:hypothetical protein
MPSSLPLNDARDGSLSVRASFAALAQLAQYVERMHRLGTGVNTRDSVPQGRYCGVLVPTESVNQCLDRLAGQFFLGRWEPALRYLRVEVKAIRKGHHQTSPELPSLG